MFYPIFMITLEPMVTFATGVKVCSTEDFCINVRVAGLGKTCPAKFYLYSVIAFLCTLCCMMLYCGVSVALYIHTGHTLGTSLFSPPPSSTSQHGIFVNSPTTTGKVAFPSVFHAVGSGLYRSSSCGWGFPVCNIACVVWV